jgi:hypothetical protein
MAAVVFDPVEFRNLKPQFAQMTDAQLEGAFELACEVVGNSEKSLVPYNPPAVKSRKLLLYALVCHFCELEKRGGGIVGTMTSATEGSVSASFSPPPLTNDANAGWYMQTQCGATAWMLMRRYTLGGRLYNGCPR